MKFRKMQQKQSKLGKFQMRPDPTPIPIISIWTQKKTDSLGGTSVLPPGRTDWPVRNTNGGREEVE